VINRLPVATESGFYKLDLWKDCQRQQTAVDRQGRSHSALPRMSINRHPRTIGSLSQYFSEIQRCGIPAVALWRSQLQETKPQMLLSMLDRHNLGVSSLSMTGAYSGSHGHTYDDAVRDSRAMINYAAKLQADVVIIRTGSQNNHLIKHMHRLVYRGLMEVIDQADHFGVKLAIQPTHPIMTRDWSCLNSLDNITRLIQRINHPLVGLSVSNYHLSEEIQLVDRLQAMIPYIKHVQLSSLPKVCHCEVKWCLQSKKQTPIAEMVRMLHDSGYKGWFEVMLSQASRLNTMKSDDSYQGCVDCFNRFWTEVL